MVNEIVEKERLRVAEMSASLQQLGVQTFSFGMESKPSDLAWSPNLQIWHGVQSFSFGMESKMQYLIIPLLSQSISGFPKIFAFAIRI
jgi:hypothetical protein